MDLPRTVTLHLPDWVPTPNDNHIVRRLSSMEGQYADLWAYAELLARGDPVLYEVYELKRPEAAGELLTGVTHLHPGKVGDEFFMTKGHFHSVMETAEVYYTLQGQGRMVMETPEGDWAVEELAPGRVLYVPPCWAHRSVNISKDEDLVIFFVYPAHAGHDYSTIETQGFCKLVLDGGGLPLVVDNPRWKAPGGRG